MLRLASLSCYLCHSQESTFFNNTDRRPCFGACAHWACTFCVDSNPNMACRICRKENAFVSRTVNYGAEGIIDEFRNDCFAVLKQWWEERETGRGTCPKCKGTNLILRICTACHQHFIFKDSDTDPPRLWLQAHQLYQFPDLLRCSSCIVDNPCVHEKSAVVRLEDLRFLNEEVKRATSHIAANLLGEEMNFTKGTCRTRWLRMWRTWEALKGLSRWHFKTPMPKTEVLRKKFPGYWKSKYQRTLSHYSRFFEPMSWEPRKRPREKDTLLVNKLFESLAFQWDHYKKTVGQEPCECTKLWEKMYHFRNPLEKVYVRMTMKVGLESLESGCLMEMEMEGLTELEELADRLSVTNAFCLPAAVCWNCRNLYNTTSRKPCICACCDNCLCLECVKTVPDVNCTFCELSYREVNAARREYGRERWRNEGAEHMFDERVMKLVNLYQEHPVAVFEEWWKSTEHGSGYCLKCRSYSEQLEICVLCNIEHPDGCIRATSDGWEFFATQSPVTSTHFQCSGCEIRLSSSLKSSPSITPVELTGLEAEIYRGCNHSRDVNGCGSSLTKSVMRVKDIRKSEFIVKWSTMEMAMKVLKGAGSEEVLNELELKTREYFAKVLGDEEEDDVAVLKAEIDDLIEKLKTL